MRRITPFAVGMFVEAAHRVDPFLAALIAGAGAFLSDMGIFAIARFSFHDELHRLSSTRMMQMLHTFMHHDRVPEKLRHYLLWSVVGLVVASPLPDEIGLTLLSGVSSIQGRKLGVLCFLLNTVGILLILLAVRAVA